MSHQTSRRLAGVGVAVVLLVACGGSGGSKRSASSDRVPTSATSSGGTDPSAPTSAGGTGFTPEAIHWESCDDGSGLDCATLDVPLDYADPSGPTTTIALDRIPANDPGKRIGSVLVNPGGPGGSGVDFVKGGGAGFGGDVLDRFDIVGFDPRGVGASSPVDCATTTVDDLRAVDADPDDAAEQDQLDTAAKAVADDCRDNAGDVLPHIGTDDVVRDMDSIRQAVGDDQLTYAGYSYGTLLGLRYLALFPTRARAIYLDGVVDPTQDFVGFLTGQAKAFETRLQAIFDDCPSGESGCPNGGAEAAYDEIAKRIETDPLPARRHAVLDPTALATAAIYATYVPSFATTFYKALRDGVAGDGGRLRDMADAYYSEGSFAVYAGVECIDTPHPVGSEAFQQFADDLRAISPRFGAAIANELLPCAYWPVPVHSIIGTVTAPDGPPTLVVGTTHDSATPYEQAVRVARDLEHGRLVTVEGEGHTSGSNRCVREIVTSYLVDLALPDEGTTCQQ
ncbi:MAG: alpha/beta hydrolase [Acidimicrobiales bacterium]